MVVQPQIERALRYQLWKSFNNGYEVWWNDANTVRQREEKGSAATFAENLLLAEEEEAAMQVEFEGRNTGENGEADADKGKGKALTGHNGSTTEGQAYVSIFGGD